MKKLSALPIRIPGLITFVVLLFLSIGWSRKEKNPAYAKGASSGKGFALLELFTSQGCSSCPPADALLAGYADQQNMQIIPLSFHVDYWDRLGWKDPFSTHANSERQEWYSGLLPRGQLYTPQLVVNGTTETVGNNRTSVALLVKAALQEATDDSLHIVPEQLRSGILNVRYHLYSSLTKNQGFLQTALVKKTSTTRILRGENAGQNLTNRNIVMQFSSGPVQSDGAIVLSLPAGFVPAEYFVVVYLQKKDGTITAVARRECSP